MAQHLRAVCVRRHPAADRTEPGAPKVEAFFTIESDDGVIGELKLTTTDPLSAAYWQQGKHYDLPLALEQPKIPAEQLECEEA